MRPEIESLTTDGTDRHASEGTFFAARWAVGLGLALLLGLAVATVARWSETAGSSSGGPETIIQQPIPPDSFPAGSRADTTAPDPGDSPPP